MRYWCGRKDSNFHEISPTATSTLRVYQFRHDRTWCPRWFMGLEIDEVPQKRWLRTIVDWAKPIADKSAGNQAAIRLIKSALLLADKLSLAYNAVMDYNLSHADTPLPGAVTHPEWRVASTPVAYPDAVTVMEQRVEAILAGTAGDLAWLLEHPPLYTAGTSASADELTDTARFPVYATGRGGRYTYHGPGQRIAYIVTDLRRRDRDIRAHVFRLEETVIRTLQDFDIKGERREGRIGIWVDDNGAEKKIAAIGVRVRRWIAYHGLSLNVHPDLNHFSGIVPCGIREFGVTSLQALGVDAAMDQVDQTIKRNAQSVLF